MLEKQLYQLNLDFKAAHEKQVEWQSQFIKKYDSNEQKILSEINDIRNKLNSVEIKTIQNEQKIAVLQNQEKMNVQQIENHDGRIELQLQSINDLKMEKLNSKVFEGERDRLDKIIDDLTLQAENHGNHFAMVENFVEKYIPVRIQSQISETLQQVLPYKEAQTLAAFEKLRFNEMHTIILEDDGEPHLWEKIKEIRFEMDHIDFKNY